MRSKHINSKFVTEYRKCIHYKNCEIFDLKFGGCNFIDGIGSLPCLLECGYKSCKRFKYA